MTIEEKKAEVALLEGKNLNASMIWGTVGLLGSIGGVVVAHRMGYKFWGKVGFFFLGGMITGVPLRLIFANKINERNSRIKLLKEELKKEDTLLNYAQGLDIRTNQNSLATITNANDLIQKSKELDAKKQANAPAGVKLSQSWLTRLDSDPKAKEMYLKEFIDNKVTFEEYNAVLKYLTSWEKSESETIKKLSSKEQNLLRSFVSKLPFKKLS